MKNHSVHLREVNLAITAAAVIILLSVITQTSSYLKGRQDYGLRLSENTENMTEDYKAALNYLHDEYTRNYDISLVALFCIILCVIIDILGIVAFYATATIRQETAEPIKYINYISLVLISMSLILLASTLENVFGVVILAAEIFFGIIIISWSRRHR